MADLKVNYMGLELKSPLIVASSTLSKSVENMIKAEKMGAGAVVVKSLFEEEIKQSGDMGDTFHPEAYDYIMGEADLLYGSKEYLDLIKELKSALGIPVIASVNCVDGDRWTEYAAELKHAGADAIELNISYVPFESSVAGDEIEQKYIQTLKAVKNSVHNIPVSVKFGQHISSIPNFVKILQDNGADAVTMFNRYYQVRIDTKNLSFHPAHYYSTEDETYNVLRWVAIVSRQLDIDISASTGIHSADTFLQQILAGAKTVQLASKLYNDGIESIGSILEEVNKWLDIRKKDSINDIRGIAVDRNLKDIRKFERLQYMKVADGRIIQ